jgi:hypothetical protein
MAMASAAEQLHFRSGRGFLERTSRGLRRAGRPDGRTPIAQGSRGGYRRARHCDGGPFRSAPDNDRAAPPSPVGARGRSRSRWLADGPVASGAGSPPSSSSPCSARRARADRRCGPSARSGCGNSPSPCTACRRSRECTWLAPREGALVRRRAARQSSVGAGSASSTAGCRGFLSDVCNHVPCICPAAGEAVPGTSLRACAGSARSTGRVRDALAHNLLLRI